jgi:RNAse (barnase) inhibitor barstar
MDKIIEEVLFSEKISDKEYYIAIIDGANCGTIKSFLKEIGKAFRFPSYYGQNMDALNDCLNDLEWIDKPNYILIVKNSNEFLTEESQETRGRILTFFQEVSMEWANVPNYSGEEIYRKRADFRVKLL